MAPSKKRGRSSSAHEWNVGDLVLAKVKGFTAWPAQVSRPENFGHAQQPTRVFVCFFGTQQVRFCHHSEISRFTPEARATLVAKANSKCSPADLRLAVSQICEAERNSSKTAGDPLLNGRSTKMELIEDENGPMNSEDGALSEPELDQTVESLSKDGETLEQGEQGNGASSEVEDAELGWGSPDSSTSLDVEDEPNTSSRGIEIPEKVQTNFASHEELDTFDAFDFYNEEVVNVPEKKKAPKARNGSKPRSSKSKKAVTSPAFTPVIPVNICRRKRKQVTVKASLPLLLPKEENTDEEHEPEFALRRKVAMVKRARQCSSSGLEMRSGDVALVEASFVEASPSPITHDPDSNLPIVKRARARSTEMMFRVESSVHRDEAPASPNPVSSPVDAPEPGKPEEKPGSEGGSTTFMVEGSLPPKAEKYRIRSSLADSEAALPPSKRRHRAFEAMSACAAEAAAEEEEQQQQQQQREEREEASKVDEEQVSKPDEEEARGDEEITKACVVADDDGEKLQELAREFVDKEVDPVSVNVSSSQAPEPLEPGEIPEKLVEEAKMNGVSSDVEEGEASPGIEQAEKQAEVEQVPEQETRVEEARVASPAEQTCNALQGENVEGGRSSFSPELSPVSMDVSEDNNSGDREGAGAEEQNSRPEEQQQQEQEEEQQGSENSEAQVPQAPEPGIDAQVSQAPQAPEPWIEAPVSQASGPGIEAQVSQASMETNEAQAPAEAPQEPERVEAQAPVAAPSQVCGVFERQDSLVQMELRPSLYKYRRRGSKPKVEPEGEKEKPAASDATVVRRDPVPLAEEMKKSPKASSSSSPPVISKYSPTDAGKGHLAGVGASSSSRRSSAMEASGLKVSPVKGVKSEELPSPVLKAFQRPRSSRVKKHSPASKNGDGSSLVSERGTTESHSGEESLASEDHSGRMIKAEITSSRTKVAIAADVSLSSLKHTAEAPVNKVREAIEAANKLKQKLALKEGETSSSMKYIMAACQSKQISGVSSMMMFEEADAGLILPGGDVSGATDAEAAREVFKGLLDSLSRAKESILRATRQAIDCAKLGLSEQVIDIIAKRLEMEQSYPRRIDLFFLVDSITQSSHNLKGTPAGVYRAIVQNALPRLLSAAAPPGSFARENRRQCLKVFKLWHERGVFPPPVIRHFMHEIELHNCDRMVMNMSRRPARNERPVDDPIRDMEGMQVDEYGSNASFSLPGLNIPRMFDEDEEANEGMKPEPGEAPEPEPAAINPAATPPPEPVDRHRRVLEDVDGELEMEDVSPENETWQRQYVSPASILSGPPLPVCSPPPLPSSPPPPPPLPPSSPPPAPPGAYSYHQDGYLQQHDGYHHLEPGLSSSPPAGYLQQQQQQHQQQNVQNSSQQGYSGSYEQYNPAIYDDGYGARGEPGYSSYGMPGFAPEGHLGSPGAQFQAGPGHHPQFGPGYAPPPPPTSHHHQVEQEYYGPPPALSHENWSEASPPPPPMPARGRFHGPGEFYSEGFDRYGEHGGGGGGEYYHHHHHHQNGPHHAPPPPPPPLPPPAAFNGANHYEGGYSSSGRYQSPERHSRRRHYSHESGGGGGGGGGAYHHHENYDYGEQQQPHYSSSSRGHHHHHHSTHEGGSYGGHEGGGAYEGGGGYGRDGYHHESSYSSHSSYSRWG